MTTAGHRPPHPTDPLPPIARPNFPDRASLAAKAVFLGCLAVLGGLSPAAAAQCDAIVAAYRDAYTQSPDLLPPLFQDDWSPQSEQPYQYDSGEGATAQMTCGADGEVTSLEISLSYDNSSRIHRLLAFTSAMQTVGFVYNPDSGLPNLMPSSASPSPDDPSKAVGEAEQNLGDHDVAKVSVEVDADGSGFLTFWVNPP